MSCDYKMSASSKARWQKILDGEEESSLSRKEINSSGIAIISEEEMIRFIDGLKDLYL